MISFSKDNIPSHLAFIPLCIEPGYNASTLYNTFVSWPALVNTHVYFYRVNEGCNFINACKELNSLMLANKDNFYRSEVGKFYFNARQYMSYQVIEAIASDLWRYTTEFDDIYKQFNTDPEFYAKLLTVKIGNARLNGASYVVPHLYRFGIAPYGISQLEYLINENTRQDIFPRNKVNLLKLKLEVKLKEKGISWSNNEKQYLNQLDFSDFDAKKLNRALRLIEVNIGLKRMFPNATLICI